MGNLLPKGVELIDQIRYVPKNIVAFELIVFVIGVIIAFIITQDCSAECIITAMVELLCCLLLMVTISGIGESKGEIRRDACRVTVSEETDTDALEENFDILEKDGFIWTIAPKR